MEIKSVTLEIPEGCNIIIGHSHFIKTVEDLHEIMVGTSAQVKFGLAFCEASGPCLIRVCWKRRDSTRSGDEECSSDRIWAQLRHLDETSVSHQLS